MEVIKSLGVAVIALLLVACGGGGGKQSNGGSVPSTSSAISSSSSLSSSSSSSSSSVVFENYADSETLNIYEGETLSHKFKVNSPALFLFLDGGTEASTEAGGFVKLWENRKGFEYYPPENFRGVDSFNFSATYDLVGPGWHIEKEKISIFVKPVSNKPAVNILSKNVSIVNGESIEVSPLWRVASNNFDFIAPDATTVVNLDGVNQKINYTDKSIIVHVDSIKTVGAKELVVSQIIGGESISASLWVNIKSVYPKYEMLMGNEKLNGVTVAVVLEEGEHEEQKNKWSKEILTLFAERKLQRQYAQYFNLIFITAPMGSPLVDDHRKIMEDDLHAHVKNILNQDAIAVAIGRSVDWTLGNKDSGVKGNTIGIPSHYGINTLVRELGHTVARMGDEHRGRHCDSSTPNISSYNTADTVPWRHWIADKNNIPGRTPEINGVGIFAFCEGFYKSVYNSVMDDGHITGPVYEEAWALRLYESMDILGSVSASLTNNHRLLQVVADIDKRITDIEWTLNGVVQEQWRNFLKIEIDEALQTAEHYQITAKLIDKTGYIRNPDAYMVFNQTDGKNKTFERKWDFVKGK